MPKKPPVPSSSRLFTVALPTHLLPDLETERAYLRLERKGGEPPTRAQTVALLLLDGMAARGT